MHVTISIVAMKTNLAMAALLLGGCSFIHGEAESEPREAGRRYEEAFEMINSLRRAQPKGTHWRSMSSEEIFRAATPETIETLERALDKVRRSAAAESVDWGVDWEKEGYDAVVRYAGPSRDLTWLGIAYSEEKLKHGEHDRFVADMSAFLRAGRHFAEGTTKTHYLTACATDSFVRAAVARNAARLPAGVLEKLEQAWRATPPIQSLADYFAAEGRVLRNDLWNVFAGTADLGEGAPATAFDPGDWAADLRISSIVSIGGKILSVGFECGVTGDSFGLRPGGRRGDLELAWVDAVAGRALVRKGEKSAIVELVARRLFPIDPDGAWERLAYWLERWAIEEKEEAEAFLARFLEKANGDKLAAFEALLASVEADFERIVPLATLSYTDLPDREKVAEEFTSLSGGFAGMLVDLRRTELQWQASDELLLAGLRHLRDPGSPLPVSKVTGDPIRLRRTEDALVFESSFLNRNRPTTLEFPLR
jgi:hypothetical protein